MIPTHLILLESRRVGPVQSLGESGAQLGHAAAAQEAPRTRPVFGCVPWDTN